MKRPNTNSTTFQVICHTDHSGLRLDNKPHKLVEDVNNEITPHLLQVFNKRFQCQSRRKRISKTMYHDMVIAYILFKKKSNRKCSWQRPNRNTKNEIVFKQNCILVLVLTILTNSNPFEGVGKVLKIMKNSRAAGNDIIIAETLRCARRQTRKSYPLSK